MTIRYLSLFDGIGAVSVAWQSLGWQCVAVAEIEPFPCAVHAHHRPAVPNLGNVCDITAADVQRLGRIDLIVGGSPCQDLSVAGKRAGLGGERSGLFHEQLRIFRAARHLCGARWLLWENVPGQERFPQTADETLLAWLAKWLDASLVFRETDGETPALLSDRTALSSGACWTRSFSAWRSGASVCSLSSTLESGPIEPRYFLSARACRGILRRAEKRGKELPSALLQALRQVADGESEQTKRQPDSSCADLSV